MYFFLVRRAANREKKSKYVLNLLGKIFLSSGNCLLRNLYETGKKVSDEQRVAESNFNFLLAIYTNA